MFAYRKFHENMSEYSEKKKTKSLFISLAALFKQMSHLTYFNTLWKLVFYDVMSPLTNFFTLDKVVPFYDVTTDQSDYFTGGIIHFNADWYISPGRFLLGWRTVSLPVNMADEGPHNVVVDLIWFRWFPDFTVLRMVLIPSGICAVWFLFLGVYCEKVCSVHGWARPIWTWIWWKVILGYVCGFLGFSLEITKITLVLGVVINKYLSKSLPTTKQSSGPCWLPGFGVRGRQSLK